jgi:hypothetical protein
MSGRKIRYFAFLLVILTVGYGIFQARVLIQGPALAVHTPTPGETLTSTLYTVTGKAENITGLTINGKAVLTNSEGSFSHTLATPDGYGIILVEAHNRFGHSVSRRIEFVGKVEAST